MADQQQSNIKQEYNNATIGLNMDQTVNQLKKGSLSFALNAAVENFDSNSINFQNEEGNELCLVFPDNLILIGNHFINELNKHIFFMVDEEISEIGYMDNNDCEYHTLVRATCLNFQVNHPILKSVHKINNCTTEIYWTDGINPRRYLDINKIPYILNSGSALCDPLYTNELDCNQLKLQPNYTTPLLTIINVVNGGNLIAGTYQFAIQYGDALGNSYTSYESITNPTPIADISISTINFNYPVGKSIVVEIDNLDSTGVFQYFNLAVIKTINAISTVELVGTYYIENTHMVITYTGQNVESIQLSIQDIFEKFPYYDIAQDITATQEILVWSDLTSIDRVNYQSIANQISLQWETWRIPPTENYSNEVNATNLRGYLRDEVYSFEICFLLKKGKQTDGFHIPGRIKNLNENQPDIPDTDSDFIGNPDYTSGGVGYSPYWKIYNTATVSGYSPTYSPDPTYKGSYQYGEFAYWESTEEYSCNEAIWGSLAGQKVRHHKFPDVLVSPICESKIFTGIPMTMGNDAVFPIGVIIDPLQVENLVNSSTVLTGEQKSEIIGFKILRGDRGTNKSIVAKGILRNVGVYEREKVKYYYPNYPYNDLNADPFLNVTNNAYQQVCQVYNIDITSLLVDPNGGPDYADVEVTDCNTNLTRTERQVELGIKEICSTTKPIIISPAIGVVGFASYERWFIQNSDPLGGVDVGYDDPILGATQVFLGPNTGLGASSSLIVSVIIGTQPKQTGLSGTFSTWFVEVINASKNCGTTEPLPAFDPTLANRQIFNSPETSFGQPFLGNILKIENVMYGTGLAHFAQVKDNAKYRLLTESAQKIALDSSNTLGNLTAPDFSSTAMFAAYQAYLTIYINGITRKNYAYSFNSIADYNYFSDVPNDMGIKQRNLETARYLIPGVQAIGNQPDDYAINNYQRETSVYLKTTSPLPFPTTDVEVTDSSRFTISGNNNCSFPGKEDRINVVSYYASLKNDIVNQWGQIYSYDTIDTGFERLFNFPIPNNTIFGGDTFISRFAFKTKLPFFIDNRVDAPDDSDIFYDELGNIAYPKYWHSSRSILKDYMSGGGLLSNIISYKAHNFDCPNNGTSTGTSTTSSTSSTTSTILPGIVTDSTTASYYDGYFYLFAYGIPNFYCESSYNTDLRQAFNNREGDFWPHVSSSIPDDWVQEHWVSIAQDNTYYYNTTFSKQNKENVFTHLPADWDKACYTYFPFRTIYSDVQTADANNRVNAWLIYRALSYFDFPQNYGKLVSVDGIQNRVILVRFENKSLLYNNLLTIDTSNPQAAYVGNPNMFKGAPPIDFAETDLGYVGSQNKMLLKIPQGQISIDAKRGQIFLISDTQAIDLGAFGSGMNRFFTDHIAFEILRWFPDVDTDNAFTGVGIHGVYDSKYDRVIITKLDYIPLQDNIKYDETNNSFYTEYVFGDCSLEGTAINTSIPTTTSTTSTLTTSSSTTTTTTTIYSLPCSSNFYFGNGGFYPYIWTINLGTSIGWVKLDYQVSNEFAKFIMNFDGIDVVNTGYRGIAPYYPYSDTSLNNSLATHGDSPETIDGIGTDSVWFYKSTSTQLMYLSVYSPIGDSIWGIRVNCPVADEPTTTTSTTSTSTSSTTSTTTSIPTTTTSSSTSTTTTTAIPTLGYGALYNWYAATDSRNIAPIGFHIPTKAECDALISFVSSLGNPLKETGSDHWDANSGTNTTGFTATGSGWREASAGGFWDLRYSMDFFTSDLSTGIGGNDVWECGIWDNHIQMWGARFTQGYSLRFIADSGTPTTMIGNDGKVYNCITIDSQTWTVENSNETKYRNGDWVHGYDGGVYTPISNGDWTTLLTEGMCYYNNDPLNA